MAILSNSGKCKNLLLQMYQCETTGFAAADYLYKNAEEETKTYVWNFMKE